MKNGEMIVEKFVTLVPKSQQTIQKIKQNASIVEPMAGDHALFDFFSSSWSSFCVRVLGLIPVEVNNPPANSHKAFELLRVRFSKKKKLSYLPTFVTTRQIRNRFSSSKTIGGYRDVNLKIRIGFKSDINTGFPVFCPV